MAGAEVLDEGVPRGVMELFKVAGANRQAR